MQEQFSAKTVPQSKPTEGLVQLDGILEKSEEATTSSPMSLEEAEVKSNIEEWKTNREVEKIEHGAEKSEEYAATAIAIAMVTMEEAEATTLEAICNRLDAETATPQTIKK